MDISSILESSLTQNYVYNSNEFYYDSLSAWLLIWNPNSGGYDVGDVVYIK
jgi:hypothetical protein